jgi:hypothetical protein
LEDFEDFGRTFDETIGRFSSRFSSIEAETRNADFLKRAGQGRDEERRGVSHTVVIS